MRLHVCASCGRRVVTRQVDRGTVPPSIRCANAPHPETDRPHCEGALLLWSREILGPTVPLFEWYRPGTYQRAKIKRVAPTLYDYILSGGLIMRSIRRER